MTCLMLFLGCSDIKKRLPKTGNSGNLGVYTISAVKNNGRNVRSRSGLLLWDQHRHNAVQRRGSQNGSRVAGNDGV
jgi:hypothetical protein